ncbi:MAG: type IV toxin-antitoxin system AbiEi family antitoxin domain-containing protein [Nocardioides sp.]
MDPVLKSICDLHGVFLRREAEDLGYHDVTIAKLVRGGEWQRVRRGAYVYGETWTSLTTQDRYGLLCRAVVRQAKTKVVLSHASSGNEWAAPLWEADLSEVHVTREDGRTGRREAGVAQHRGRLIEGDHMLHKGLRIMSATRTALELTTLFDTEHALVDIDNFLHRQLTTPEQLESRYRLMNHWPDTLRTDLILRLADGRAESVGETRIRYLCWMYGLPAPIPNYPIRDRHGRVIHRVDLAWPELGLFLEFDGKVKYQRHLKGGETVTDAVLREKRREELICELTGWRCIRVVWADLYTPAATADRIRAMFRTAAA